MSSRNTAQGDTTVLSNKNPPSREGTYSAARHDDRDHECGFEILEDFERFNQANDIYARGRWDANIRSQKVFDWFKSMFQTGVNTRSRDGYTAKDFAFKVAGWTGTNIFVERNLDKDRADGFLDDIEVFFPPAKEKVVVESPRQMAREMKKVCRFFGAADVGITAIDERWHYSRKFNANRLSEKSNNIPDGLENVIVITAEMDPKLMQLYPSATAGAAVGYGYSQDAFMLQSIATFIHALGYRAVASMNDTAQRIPYAIQAGLGEYSRATFLITKKLGPRVRLGQIFTDLPLQHDKPTSFGVREFCQICRRCSDACPPRAIPAGEPQDKAINRSNFVGVRKWSVDAEKCFKFWTNQGTECGICIRVCPYHKDTSTWYGKFYHRFWVWLAGTKLRRVALWLDLRLGFGARKTPRSWWTESR